MNQERDLCELMECMRKATEKRINEITARPKTEEERKIKALIGLRVFITNKDMEYCEAAKVKEEKYTGEMLMKGGFLFKDFWGDAVSRLYHFVKL